MNAWEQWLRLHNEWLNRSMWQTKDLAEYLKVNRRTIEFWINGKLKPSEKRIEQIAEYLKQEKENNGKIA